MSKFCAAAVLLLAMAALAVWSGQTTRAIGTEMGELLTEAEAAVSAGDWTAAQASHRAAADLWARRERYLSIVLRHADIDQITISMAEAGSYIESRTVPDYRAVHSRLIRLIRHLCETERLKLTNVL